MAFDSKEYLDKFFLDPARDKEKQPDCYLIFKTDSYGRVVGEPLAIFKNKQSLYDKLQKISDETDGRWGICVGIWWFDD